MENIIIPKEIFKVQGEQVFVDSRDVAKFYGMQHQELLRAIDNKLEILPELRNSNIAVSSYKVPGNRKSYRCYLLDKRGFLAVTMGLTGERAARVQLAFVDAFMEMEARLSKPRDFVATSAALPSKEESILRAAILLGEEAETPKHITLNEAVKEIRRVTGTDLQPILLQGNVNDNVKPQEEMLEPTDLGVRFKSALDRLGYLNSRPGVNLNTFLSDEGVQTKSNSFWGVNRSTKPIALNTIGKKAIKAAII